MSEGSVKIALEEDMSTDASPDRLLWPVPKQKWHYHTLDTYNIKKACDLRANHFRPLFTVKKIFLLASIHAPFVFRIQIAAALHASVLGPRRLSINRVTATPLLPLRPPPPPPFPSFYSLSWTRPSSELEIISGRSASRVQALPSRFMSAPSRVHFSVYCQ